jgi:hypothetical protein
MMKITLRSVENLDSSYLYFQWLLKYVRSFSEKKKYLGNTQMLQQ